MSISRFSFALLCTSGLPVGGHAQATRPSGSDVRGFAIVEISRLPVPTIPARVPEFCQHYDVETNSESAKYIRAHGWVVTGEAKIGPYAAVSFAGRLEPATSGTCYVQDGNIAVLRGGQLLALVYAPRSGRRSIGRVTSLEDGGVRVWDGDIASQPVADLRLGEGSGSFRLSVLAAQETQCGGAAVIPNIYGRRIDQARTALIAQGWRPVPGDPAADSPFGREAELRKRGLPEVDGCSGTGFGYCNFSYGARAGRLSVTTMGDAALPVVVGYRATCL